MARCVSGVEFAYCGATTTVKNHIGTCAECNKGQTAESHVAGQQTITVDGCSGKLTSKATVTFNPENCLKLLVDMIIRDELH